MLLKNIISTHFKQVPFFFFYCRNFCNTSFQLRRFGHEDNVTKNVNKTSPKTRILRSLQRKKTSDYFGHYSFVVDDGVADLVTEKVMKAVRNMDSAVVIEVNPGIGKITKLLIEKGLKKLIICEPLEGILCEEIIKQFREKITMITEKSGMLEFNEPEHIFPNDLQVSEDETAIIIAVNISRRLLRRVIERVVLVDEAYMKNVEFYLLLSEDVYSCFEGLHYKHSNIHDYVFFDLVFHKEVLAELPRSAILPPTMAENKKIYFVRLQRKDLNTTGINTLLCWQFLTVFGMKRNTPILAILEKWFPSCGLLLIAKGFSVSTKIRELSKSDFIILFSIMQEYENFESTLKIMEEDIFMQLQ